VTRPELLAVFDEDERPRVLAQRYLYVPAPSRDGTSSARVQAACVYLHEPTAAVLLPSELPLLSQRRPEFSGLRHVLARFSFMPSRLPARQSYTSITFSVTCASPDAVVRLQRPAWKTTEDSETTDTVTTQLSAAVDSLAQLAAQRTRVRGTTRHSGQLPVITAEKRDRGDFGWRYEAREGAPLVPKIEYALAWIELSRDSMELSGRLSAEAVIEVPRLGVLRALRAVPAAPPVPFRIPLSPAPA
jgi:hypothetical protein